MKNSKGYAVSVICIGICIFLQVLPAYAHDNSGQTADTVTILFTGFEPFADFDCNPSQLIVTHFHNTTYENASVSGVVLPVNFTTSVENVINCINQIDPDIIVSFGLASGSRWVNIEQFAWNLKHDPEDPSPYFQQLQPDDKWVYRSTLPTRKIVTMLRSEEVPARMSWSAGTYICNAVFYNILATSKVQDADIMAGFVHVPPLDNQTDYGMSWSHLEEAVEIIIDTCLTSYENT